MPRTFSIASLTTASLAAACFAPPVLAQGVLKPVDAVIVNPASRPVPVTVIAPSAAALPPTAICHISTGAAPPITPGSPFGGSGVVLPMSALSCRGGVTRLDVHRVLFQPHGVGAHFKTMVNLIPDTTADAPGAADVVTVLATLTEGAPDISLARPLRIDGSAPTQWSIRHICGSGIAGFEPQCGGTVFLIGTPVN